MNELYKQLTHIAQFIAQRDKSPTQYAQPSPNWNVNLDSHKSFTANKHRQTPTLPKRKSRLLYLTHHTKPTHPLWSLPATVCPWDQYRWGGASACRPLNYLFMCFLFLWIYVFSKCPVLKFGNRGAVSMSIRAFLLISLSFFNFHTQFIFFLFKKIKI